MRSMIIVPGRAPAWVRDQVRLAADGLTDDGLVLVAQSDAFEAPVHLPGTLGASTLLGVSRTGFPIWTGRRLAIWGMRRRQDRTVVVLFDGARPVTALGAALVARVRRERVTVNDLRSPERRQSAWSRVLGRATCAVAHERVASPRPQPDVRRALVYAICNHDRAFAELVVKTATAMSAETAVGWRFVIQSDDAAVTSVVSESLGSDFVSVEGSPQVDILHACDVVVVAHGPHDDLAEEAARAGAAGVIVGHPIADRMTRRLDGVFVTRHDVSSVIVALESARGRLYGEMRPAPEIRRDAEALLASVRGLALA